MSGSDSKMFPRPRSPSKIPSADLDLHNVNSVETFSLPQWVFLGTGPSAEQAEAATW